MINVTIYNEFVHEKIETIKSIYPNGIHGAIKEKLLKYCEYNIRTATLDTIEEELSNDVLDSTDVLIWWGHIRHNAVPCEIAKKVQARVLSGMGLIVLHSGHLSKPFRLLLGTSCDLKWRENDEKERIWVIEPSHPIAKGLPEYIEIDKEETYGERFDIPTPDTVVFTSWFSGGEVFRSGVTFTRGMGKIFYFRPGHEEYPTFYRDDIIQIIRNAIEWAKPTGATCPTFGNFKALENVDDKFAGKSDDERSHKNLGKDKE